MANGVSISDTCPDCLQGKTMKEDEHKSRVTKNYVSYILKRFLAVDL